MRISFGLILCSALAGILASSPALAKNKTAKECRQEWQTNKAANEAKKITEKAYVEKCKTEAATEPMAKPAAAKTTKEEPAKEKTREKAAKEKTSEKAAAPAGASKKTAKECEDEWRANKAANQAKKITEKAYVETCRSGSTAETPAAAPAAAPKQTTSTPMAPAKSAAPATGSPAGANQYAAESQAKAHCLTGTVVWANLKSKIYHFSGHDDYGHTKEGAYMCEKDATSQGMRAAKNEKHP